ncbi:hypothetical protein [Microbacterium suwonense]|uniref:Uncharacterized protein n=1 Tax=Microbacterium suwonense TaxID=683047 RepID=A0ABN6X160_9MICO|nr:hypothetical protein [Microbacterium suwonense]BDZ38455.1 hypothetical protein GCM10025863_10690 [Microbacterium suwonense]
MNPRVLALLLRPSRDQLAVIALPAIAFALVTTLLLAVIGGAQKFWTWTDADAGLYQALAAIALVLLVVPLATLGGAAARLSARRRDERLSTLRLLGVSPPASSPRLCWSRRRSQPPERSQVSQAISPSLRGSR